MLAKLFGSNPKETTIRTEILAVNPSILEETGMDKEGPSIYLYPHDAAQL